MPSQEGGTTRNPAFSEAEAHRQNIQRADRALRRTMDTPMSAPEKGKGIMKYESEAKTPLRWVLEAQMTAQQTEVIYGGTTSQKELQKRQFEMFDAIHQASFSTYLVTWWSNVAIPALQAKMQELELQTEKLKRSEPLAIPGDFVLNMLKSYIEINDLTRPVLSVIEKKGQKIVARYINKDVLKNAALGGSIDLTVLRAYSESDVHKEKYQSFIGIMQENFDNPGMLKARYISYTRPGFAKTPLGVATELREFKELVNGLAWHDVMQKAYEVLTAPWAAVPSLQKLLEDNWAQDPEVAEYRQADSDMLNELAEMVRIREDVVQKDELKEANNRLISQPYLPVGGSSRQQATDVINMRDPETGKLVKAVIVTNAKGVTQVRYLCDDCTKAKGKEMYHSKGFKGCVNHQGTTTVGQTGTHNRGGQQGGGGGKTEGCWNKCGQNGHMYTECSKPISDPRLLKRLQVNQRERERRVAFAKQMGWELDSSTGLPKHDKAPRGGASSATAGPDLQQLLEKLDKVSTDLETLKQKGKAAVSESPHPPPHL